MSFGGKGNRGKANRGRGGARPPASEVQADPYFMKQLPYEKHLSGAVRPFVSDEGSLSQFDQDITPFRMMEFTKKNSEMYHRPAHGISESCGTIAHCIDKMAKHFANPTGSLVDVDMLSPLLTPLAEIHGSFAVLQCSKDVQPNRSEIDAALAEVSKVCANFSKSSRLQTISLGMKQVGLAMYHLAIHTEQLSDAFGDVKKFREKLGNLDKQDPSIAQWTQRKAGDEFACRRFLAKSILQRLATEDELSVKRKSRKAVVVVDVLDFKDDDFAATSPRSPMARSPSSPRSVSPWLPKARSRRSKASALKNGKKDPPVAKQGALAQVLEQLSALNARLDAVENLKTYSQPSTAIINIEEEIKAAKRQKIESDDDLFG